MSTNDGDLIGSERMYSRSNRNGYAESQSSAGFKELRPTDRSQRFRGAYLSPSVDSMESDDIDENEETYSARRVSSNLDESPDFASDTVDDDGNEKASHFTGVVEGQRLVIAIDYGTTFTGVAIASVPIKGKAAKLSDIHPIVQWNNMSNAEKVPSVYSYTKTKSGHEQWGNSFSEDAVVMVQTKLELDAQHSSYDELDTILHYLEGMQNLDFDDVVKTGGNPDSVYKRPEIVMLDYMKKIFDRVWKYFGPDAEDLIRSMPVDVVITHPVVWSYKARNATYRAVTQAGFNSITFPNIQPIMMLAEPEAAAVYTARHLKEEAPGGKSVLDENKTFVLCDAGGGTVDVVTFQVVGTEPLELKQIGEPHSSKCGSVFIDNTFKCWLRDKVLGPDRYEELEPGTRMRLDTRRTSGKMKGIMEEFIKHKRAFTGDEGEKHLFTIELGHEFSDVTIDGWVKEGQITIDKSLMIDFFKECVTEIVELVKMQAEEVDSYEDQGYKRVKTILMVGGFGESKYLQSAVEKMLRRSKITVLQPKTSWSAVFRGAALYGIEKSRLRNYVNTASYPYYYAVARDVVEVPGMSKTQYSDPITGKIMGKNRLSWIVHRGDLAFSDYSESRETPLVFNFLENGERNFTISIYRYLEDDDILPIRVRGKNDIELELALSIPISFTQANLEEFEAYQSVRGREPYYQAVVSLYLTWRNQSLGATVVWRGNVIYSSDRT